MLPADAEDYERRVSVATDPLDSFFVQLVGELDDQAGGFSWWSGYLANWKMRTLLSDYLIQSVHGVSEALISASFGARNHRQMTVADTEAAKKAHSEGRIPFPLDAQGRRRHLNITQSAESCFYHLGQALDRLSATMIVVGGFGMEVVRVDWGDVEDLAEGVTKQSTKIRLQPLGTPGRAAQDALMDPVLNWHTFGPDDWLPWMRDTRNGMTHRAGGKKIIAMTTANRLARLFYRQPRWSELQSLVFGARPPKTPFYDAFIMSASEDVLEGLCESVATLVGELTKAIVTCWDARAANPQLIAQPDKQWQVVEPAESIWNFPGYGTPVVIRPGVLRLSPPDGKRWTAARVMDDRRSAWY
ncbi:hypothetical protein [Mycobacterium sp. 852002-40037_SCH5390672]|uniref:hypothetical protein n=1 Tax=Mycobacterium sp. 852002-40037_SCH5390672 TaxID=1834089 RepID=UPI0008049E73|nr:hypothetical protein [Mycobacterium sp. 852002-40037_SCH5390672]OBB95924.1 hypothetical protein A5782_05620 [Mycobacterium sp. 852002-40037_SCH5390672]